MFSKRWMFLGVFPWIHGCELYLGAGEGILWECPAVPDACVCGDNRVSPELGEVCDDGNADDFDGCSSSCGVETVVSIVAGAWHTCALTDGGAVKCWGDNRYGQLGLGDRENRGDAPNELTASGSAVVLGKLDRAVALAAGEFHTCVLLDDGRIKCWGLNGVGQLGLGDTNNRGDEPEEMGDELPAVKLPGKALEIAAGAYHTCVLLEDKRVQCWGANGSGQLGLGHPNPHRNASDAVLVDLGAGQRAVRLAAGGYFTCAILENGSVKCWGQNRFGQLGLGTGGDRGNEAMEMGDDLPPVMLGSGAPNAITLGQAHACVRLGIGFVKCWGNNVRGQLGLGDVEPRGLKTSQMGDALPSILQGEHVSAGDSHTCVVTWAGTVKCWGWNEFGQLGQGTKENVGDQPGEVETLSDVNLGADKAKMVTTGQTHTCALLEDDSVACWGGNASGQLGAGDTKTRGDGTNELFAKVKLFSNR